MGVYSAAQTITFVADCLRVTILFRKVGMNHSGLKGFAVGRLLRGMGFAGLVALPLGHALAVEIKAETKADAKVETRTDARSEGRSSGRESRENRTAAARDAGDTKSAKDREGTFQQAFVTVNGAPQSVAMAELLLREQLLRGATDSPELRNGVREALVANALMEQEARKSGLDKNPLLQAQMDMARQRVLINAWQQKMLADDKIGDEQVTAEYNRQVQRMAPNDVRIRQVLVADEVSAKLLLDKARSGGKMDELAKEYSREPGAKDTGGLSDWINLSDLLPPLAQAVTGAAKGKLLDQPVQTPNGWHVILVDDVRAFKPLALEEIKPQILGLLQQRALQEKLKGLRGQAKVQ